MQKFEQRTPQKINTENQLFVAELASQNIYMYIYMRRKMHNVIAKSWLIKNENNKNNSIALFVSSISNNTKIDISLI